MARRLSWGRPQKCPMVASLLYGKLEFVDLKNMKKPQKCDLKVSGVSQFPEFLELQNF